MDELAIRISIVALLLALAVALLFLDYAYGPHRRSASRRPSMDEPNDASNTDSGHQSSQRGAEGDRSQTSKEGDRSW